MDWISSDIANFLGTLDDESKKKHFVLRILRHMPRQGKPNNIGSKRKKQPKIDRLASIEEESPEELLKLEAWEAESSDESEQQLQEELQDAVRAKLALERRVRALEQRLDQLQHISLRVPLLRQGVMDLIRTGGTTSSDALSALERCFDFSESDILHSARAPLRHVRTTLASAAQQFGLGECDVDAEAGPEPEEASPRFDTSALEFIEAEIPPFLASSGDRQPLCPKAFSDMSAGTLRLSDALDAAKGLYQSSLRPTASGPQKLEEGQAYHLATCEEGEGAQRSTWLPHYLGLRTCVAPRQQQQKSWARIAEGSRRNSD